MNTTILIISNLIGAMALAFWTISMQVNKKSTLMKFQLIANFLYAIQYLLIGAITAATMNIISVVRYYIYYKNEEKGKDNTYFMLFTFILIIIIMGAITYNGAVNIIPIAISIVYTYATWQKDVKIIRYVIMFAAIIWIFYNMYVGAYITIVGNVMEVISSLTAIIRYDKMNNNKIKLNYKN